jgi:hypothetical protein
VEEVIASHGPEVHKSFHPRLTKGYIDGLEAQKNFLRDHGFLKGDFSVAEWIDPRPLAEAQKLVERDAHFTAARSSPRPAQAEARAQRAEGTLA